MLSKFTKRRKDHRVQWVSVPNHMNETDKWLSILFTDKKKFNLDNPTDN